MSIASLSCCKSPKFSPERKLHLSSCKLHREWWGTDASAWGFPIRSLLNILISSQERSHCQHICVGLCWKHTLSWIPTRLQRHHLMSHLMFIRPRETTCLQFSMIFTCVKTRKQIMLRIRKLPSDFFSLRSDFPCTPPPYCY